ncbi:MAG TPA: hypothetical protein VEQ58_03260 [Polyangiaceae bacterium]|nr:hypothetical protein [Polyangiaceae bacterium]
MLPLSAALFSTSAVALVSSRSAFVDRVGAVLTALLSLWACRLSWGWGRGLLVQFVLAMAAASALVLVAPLLERRVARSLGAVSCVLALALLCFGAVR